MIGLLDGPGVVKELDYRTYILLAPEWINACAQAVIRTLRSAENDLGVLPLRSIAEGKLIYQSIGRAGDLVEMKRQLEQCDPGFADLATRELPSSPPDP